MRIFISYQRADSQHAAGRLNTLLTSNPKIENVFFDRTSIGIGRRWKDVLLDEIKRTEVVLAVIGSAWNPERLHHDDDQVRFELRTAHGLGKLFVPVIVDGGDIPQGSRLPDDTRWLVDWQAFRIHRETFDRDAGYLMDDLVKLESGEPEAEPVAPQDRRPGLAFSSPEVAVCIRGLWVDDHPDNNERERGVLEDFGIEFDLAISTSEAMRKIRRRPYDLVISDMARRSRSERDRHAGLTLIDEIGAAGLELPVIIYGAGSAERLRDEVISRGGAGSTSSPFELYELVRRCVSGNV